MRTLATQYGCMLLCAVPLPALLTETPVVAELVLGNPLVSGYWTA
jgi:hypothetical protein